MKIRLASEELLTDSIVDGEGLRAVIWTQGCSHHCKGCHNPETWDFKAGFLTDTDTVKKKIDELAMQDGITFSGGDPFFQLDACIDIAKYAKEKGLNIWSYTGFVFEDLLNNAKAKEFLKYVDVLIDGPFQIDKKSLLATYRGSTNQRIINVKKSLKDGKVHQIKKYDRNRK